MKSEKGEKVKRFLLSLICFTAYISLFIVVMANAISTGSNPRLRG
jgi:hypothetical protein